MGMGMAGAKEPASTRFATKMRPGHMQCKTESKSLPGERARKSSSRIASTEHENGNHSDKISKRLLIMRRCSQLLREEWYKHHIAG